MGSRGSEGAPSGGLEDSVQVACGTAKLGKRERCGRSYILRSRSNGGRVLDCWRRRALPVEGDGYQARRIRGAGRRHQVGERLLPMHRALRVGECHDLRGSGY